MIENNKKFKRHAPKIGGVLLFFIFLSSCDFFRKDTIIIGEFMTKSGPDATFGINARKGIQLAIGEVNSSGGIDGKQVELSSSDPKGLKSETEETIKTFANQNEVLAVIGEIASERSNWAARIAQNLGLPMISPSSTNPSVTEKGNYIFRACYIDPFQGYAMAHFAKDKGFQRVGVLINNRSNYSLGLSEYFIDTFRQLGGRILVEETYTHVEGVISLKSQVAVIKKSRIEALFIPVYYSDAAAIAKELRHQGVRIQLLGGDGWDSKELFGLGGDAIDGVYFTNHFSAQSTEPAAMRFVQKFEKRFGSKPDGTAAMGYDAAAMVLASMKAVVARGESLTRPRLRQELSRVRDFAGVTGPITIDENRNARKPIVILQARKGKFEYVKMVRPK